MTLPGWPTQLSRTFLDVNFGLVGLEIAMHDEPDVGLVSRVPSMFDSLGVEVPCPT